MNNNNFYNSNYLLLLLFIIISIIIYFLNVQIINSFRDEAREQVRALASEYSEAITNSNDDEIRFILDIMLPSLKFPMIIKNNIKKFFCIYIELMKSYFYLLK